MLIGLAVGLGAAGLLACCAGIYFLSLRRQTWLLANSYPGGTALSQVWEASPRSHAVGGWSQFGESVFPADERLPDAVMQARIAHFFRERYNSTDGYETSTALFRSY